MENCIRCALAISNQASDVIKSCCQRDAPDTAVQGADGAAADDDLQSQAETILNVKIAGKADGLEPQMDPAVAQRRIAPKVAQCGHQQQSDQLGSFSKEMGRMQNVLTVGVDAFSERLPHSVDQTLLQFDAALGVGVARWSSNGPVIARQDEPMPTGDDLP